MVVRGDTVLGKNERGAMTDTVVDTERRGRELAEEESLSLGQGCRKYIAGPDC